MRFLVPYIRRNIRPFLLAVLLLTVEALSELMMPTLMAVMIDQGVAHNRMDVVMKWGGLMLLITGIGAIGAAGRNVISGRVSQRFGSELRYDLYAKIQGLSFPSLNRFERASLMTRLTQDVTQVQNFVNGLMRIFVKAPLLCIGSLILAIRLNPQLAVVPMAVVPVVGLLVYFNMKIGFRRFTLVQKAMDKVNLVLREYLSGVRVVKAFNRNVYEEGKFDAVNDAYRHESTAVMRTMSLFNPAMMLTVNLGIVGILWLGGFKVDTGQTDVGHIIAFVNYMTQILFSLMMISFVFMMFVRAQASALRIGEVLEAEQGDQGGTEKAGEQEHRGSIEFCDVSFSYGTDSGTPVLKGITMLCKPGETTGIIGSTGSGKSTLVHLIPGFYRPDSGVIRVDGMDVEKWNPESLREHVALVPQKPLLFTGSIAENIRWGKEEATLEEIIEAAKLAEAHEFISSFPEGYEARVGQRGVNLSGGQKQRISLARALVKQPDILLLDDCTSAVDVSTEAKIKASLRKVSQKTTILLIAQRISSVVDADQIIVMEDGRIAAAGSHMQLMRESAIYREIYRSQYGEEGNYAFVNGS
ncbi:ABC transporter ATP-binding protein [Paenibacillus gansuensis]|uniref:ABC transporter ATP-binding protein n=1 Tax=Paenibacillus gansuensis TaxID=306542 RepID=A0ABW5PEF3_9BACL